MVGSNYILTVVRQNGHTESALYDTLREGLEAYTWVTTVQAKAQNKYRTKYAWLSKLIKTFP